MAYWGADLPRSSFVLSRSRKFSLCRGGQSFSVIPNFLDSAVGHSPTAFTASVISSHAAFFFALVTLSENLDLIRSKFSSTFSVNTVTCESDQLVFSGRLYFPCCIAALWKHWTPFWKPSQCELTSFPGPSLPRKIALWDTNRQLAKLIGDYVIRL